MSKKIRVLFAIDEMSAGGSQRQIIGILQRLDRTRFEPQLYVVADHGELLSEVPADVPVHIFAKRHPRRQWWIPGQWFRARVRDVASVLTEQHIDAIYDRTYHMTLVAAPAARQTNTPRLSTIVTDPRRDFEGSQESFRWLKRRMLKTAYQTADRVVAVSEGVRKAAMEHYDLQHSQAVTLHNFFDIERLDALASQPLPATETRREGDGSKSLPPAGCIRKRASFICWKPSPNWSTTAFAARFNYEFWVQVLSKPR